MNTELKPCPFCGNKAVMITDHVTNMKPYSVVRCKKCDITTKSYFDDPFSGQPCKEIATEAWNIRIDK